MKARLSIAKKQYNNSQTSVTSTDYNRLLITQQHLIIHFTQNEQDSSSRNGLSQVSHKRVLVTQRPNDISELQNIFQPKSSPQSREHSNSSSPTGQFQDHGFLSQNSSMTLSKYEFIKRQQQHSGTISSQSAEQLPALKSCASGSSKVSSYKLSFLPISTLE